MKQTKVCTKWNFLSLWFWYIFGPNWKKWKMTTKLNHFGSCAVKPSNLHQFQANSAYYSHWVYPGWGNLAYTLTQTGGWVLIETSLIFGFFWKKKNPLLFWFWPELSPNTELGLGSTFCTLHLLHREGPYRYDRCWWGIDGLLAYQKHLFTKNVRFW